MLPVLSFMVLLSIGILWQVKADDGTGPTSQRRAQAGKDNIRETGRGRSNVRVYMLDDALSKALTQQYIDQGEYSALKKYALHWLASGLQGQLSVGGSQPDLCVQPASHVWHGENGAAGVSPYRLLEST